ESGNNLKIKKLKVSKERLSSNTIPLLPPPPVPSTSNHIVDSSTASSNLILTMDDMVSIPDEEPTFTFEINMPDQDLQLSSDTFSTEKASASSKNAGPVPIQLPKPNCNLKY
ncbi:unnamed protein product, partial [Allacma fusca]